MVPPEQRTQTAAAGGALTAKQAPRWPGTAPAPGLRADRVATPIPEQTADTKEIVMWFHSHFDRFPARSTQTPTRRRGPVSRVSQRPRSLRPFLETLEGRRLLSTYVVNSLGDTGAGTGLTGDLRYCVAHATSGNDTITFGVTGTIELESYLPVLNTSVAILGPGADLVTVGPDPAQSSSSGIFAVDSAATVQISGLTIARV